MIGLSVTAAVFIVFALVASFVAPKRWPDFPGKNGMSVFIIACLVLFGAMITAVELFGVEEEEAHATGHTSGHASGGGQVGQTIQVQEKEFRIVLPALKTLPPGDYEFDVKNVGKAPHDLVIEGGDLTHDVKTPTIEPGGEAKLTVTLSKGQYTLYCSIDGHRKLGMLAKIAVG
jgi:plastocyanin